jgi:cell wall-associated NlpC family hydrolase
MKLEYEHLLGRPYVPGEVHCYKLLRDFYRDNFGIEAGNYALPNDWNADELNLIEMIWEREGMIKVEDWTIRNLRPGDVLCLAVNSKNPNHFAIYVGGNKLIHHAFGKFSCEETMRDFWRMATCFVLRHPAVPDLTPALPSSTLKDMADARYHPQAEA